MNIWITDEKYKIIKDISTEMGLSQDEIGEVIIEIGMLALAHARKKADGSKSLEEVVTSISNTINRNSFGKKISEILVAKVESGELE